MKKICCLFFMIFILNNGVSFCFSIQSEILQPGMVVTGSLVKGESDSYFIDLQKGSFVRAQIRKRPWEVAAFAFSPSGKQVAAQCSERGEQWPVLLSFVADEAGRYEIQVRPFGTKTPEGATMIYDIQIIDLLSAEAYALRQEKIRTDPRVHWCRNHAAEIKSIDPNDLDFSDLAPLKEKIGDARVVLLGEQRHFEGKTFDAKVRLIKFLHREMGFQVLAFESPIYDVYKLWQDLLSGKATGDDWQKGVFGIWTTRHELTPLIDYFHELMPGKNPLLLWGIDNQFTGWYSKNSFGNDLKKLLDAGDKLPLENVDRFIEIFLDLIDYNVVENKVKIPQHEKEWFLKTLDLMITHARSSFSGSELTAEAVLLRALLSLKGYAPYYFGDPSDSSLRDVLMGRNLVWLAQDIYPKKKIILWAATFHIARNLPEITYLDGSERYTNTVTLGDGAFAYLGEQMYSIGFTSYQGRWGTNLSKFTGDHGLFLTIGRDQSPELEFEEILFHAGLENAFIDFKHLAGGAEWLKGPFVRL